MEADPTIPQTLHDTQKGFDGQKTDKRMDRFTEKEQNFKLQTMQQRHY